MRRFFRGFLPIGRLLRRLDGFLLDEVFQRVVNRLTPGQSGYRLVCVAAVISFLAAVLDMLTLGRLGGMGLVLTAENALLTPLIWFMMRLLSPVARNPANPLRQMFRVVRVGFLLYYFCCDLTFGVLLPVLLGFPMQLHDLGIISMFYFISCRPGQPQRKSIRMPAGLPNAA